MFSRLFRACCLLSLAVPLAAACAYAQAPVQAPAQAAVEAPPATPAAAANPDADQRLLTAGESLEALAARYTQLALSLAVQDAGALQGWDGPIEWLENARGHAADADRQPLAIAAEARELRRYLSEHPQAGDVAAEIRSRYLQARLDALLARALQLNGTVLSFDAETKALYGLAAPRVREADLEPALAELDHLLPKTPGSLAQRHEAFRRNYRIPRASLQAIVQTALAEARSRTREHLALPAGEQLQLRLAGPEDAVDTRNTYRYLGGYRGELVLDPAQPMEFSEVLERVTRDGYPGRHVAAVLREQRLRAGRLPIEQQLQLRASPQALLDEGAAAAGIGLVFPAAQRHEVLTKLFAQAGFRRSVETYARVVECVSQLAESQAEAERRYLDGRLDAGLAQAWLRSYALVSASQAAAIVEGFARERSAYAAPLAGRMLVQRYLDARSVGAEDPAVRWHWLESLYLQPRAPLDLLP